MIQKDDRFFAHLTLGVGLLHFHKFELTAEGQERMKMMFS